eukprot:1351691-Rhodomonas_salina.1
MLIPTDKRTVTDITRPVQTSMMLIGITTMLIDVPAAVTGRDGSETAHGTFRYRPTRLLRDMATGLRGSYEMLRTGDAFLDSCYEMSGNLFSVCYAMSGPDLGYVPTPSLCDVWLRRSSWLKRGYARHRSYAVSGTGIASPYAMSVLSYACPVLVYACPVLAYVCPVLNAMSSADISMFIPGIGRSIRDVWYGQRRCPSGSDIACYTLGTCYGMSGTDVACGATSKSKPPGAGLCYLPTRAVRDARY